MEKTHLYLALYILTTGCGLSVNTTDPRHSKDISDSKKNGLFRGAYYAPASPIYFKMKEAWIEPLWFNDIDGFKVIKTVDSSHCHLCLTIDNTSTYEILGDTISNRRWLDWLSGNQ
jgi:hypothetical protein